MVNSRQKGAAGERELAKLLRGYGYKCRRGQQYAGGADSPDVLGLPGVHIECKRVERLNIHKAMEQSARDSGRDEIPAVFHRTNRNPWLVTVSADDFIKLYRRATHE